MNIRFKYLHRDRDLIAFYNVYKIKTEKPLMKIKVGKVMGALEDGLQIQDGN